MYLGRRFKANGNANRVFNSGGAAYVLNQASVGLLASHLDDDACEAHRKCSWEDVQVTSERAREGGKVGGWVANERAREGGRVGDQ